MKFTDRDKRAVIVGICVVAAALIYYAITSLLPNQGDLTQTVEIKKKTLLQKRETLNREGIYRTRLEQFAKQLDLDKARLLPGDSPNVAAAELQKILKDFADQCGVEITQKSFLTEKEKKIQDLLIKVSVKIDTMCNLEQLVAFLTAIENYDKHLVIDDFIITSFPIQRRREIRPSLTISGYISAPEAKS